MKYDMFQFSPFIIYSRKERERERAVKRIKLLTHFWCRETEYFWYFLSLLNKANILKKWYCCRLFQVITTTKKKKKSSSQLCHKGLFFLKFTYFGTVEIQSEICEGAGIKQCLVKRLIDTFISMRSIGVVFKLNGKKNNHTSFPA